jgi:hemerythrin
MPFRWTNAISIGVPDLDRQHQELFSRVEQLHDAMLRNERSEAARLLRFLRAHTALHFEAEERLMASTGYPDALRHCAEHSAFARELRSLDAHFAEQGTSSGLVLQLEQLTVAWLRDHVHFSDVALGRWIRTHAHQAATPGA